MPGFDFGADFGFPKVFVTTSISYGYAITSAYITVQYTGNIQFQLSNDGGTTWKQVNCNSNTRTLCTFDSSAGTDLLFMAIGNPGAVIATTSNSNGSLNKPGIKIEINYT